MRLVSLTLSLIAALIASLLVTPAKAQEVINSYVTDASQDRLVEVSAMQPGLWLHFAPVDRNGVVLAPPTPVCRTPCTERVAMGFYGASVSTSESDPIAAAGVISLDRDLNLQLDFADNSATRIGMGLVTGIGILYAIGAIIAGALLPDSSGINTALLSTGITVGILSLCFVGLAFTPDEAAVRVLQF